MVYPASRLADKTSAWAKRGWRSSGFAKVFTVIFPSPHRMTTTNDIGNRKYHHPRHVVCWGDRWQLAVPEKIRGRFRHFRERETVGNGKSRKRRGL